ncbi:MAG: PAS domain S-box protein [Saprospiraceae bacterium]
MHSLLLQQLEKYLSNTKRKDAEFSEFLNSINASNDAFEEDKKRLLESLSTHEKELQELKAQLSDAVFLKQDSVEKLLDFLAMLDIKLNVNQLTDIEKVSETIDVKIQENKEKEYHIFKTNNLFKTLLANLKSGVLVENEHREILFTNRLFCEIFGIPLLPADMVGMDCSDSAEQSKSLFKEPEVFVKTIETLIQKKLPVYGELIVTNNGRYLERDYIPIFIGNDYRGHLWQYKDVTSKMQIDRLLRDSEELNRLIMTNAMDAIIIANHKGNFIFWNPAAEELFGWKKEDVLGKSIASTIVPERLRKVHIDGFARFQLTKESRVMGKRIELPALHSSGREFMTEMYMIDFIQNDAILFCAFFKDITQRKIQEEKITSTTQKLESIFNEMTDVVWSITLPNFEVLFVTPSLETVFEIKVEDFSRDFTLWHKVIVDEDKDVLEKIGHSLNATNEFNEVYRIKTPSGKVKWLRNKGKFIFDDNHNPIRLDGVVTDRTSQYLAQEALDQELKLQEALIDIASTYINLDPKDLENTINLSLQKMGLFVASDRAYIFYYDFQGGTTSNVYEWCNEGIPPEIDNLQNVPLEFIPQWVEKHKSGEAFYIPDVALLGDSDAGLKAILEPQGIKSLIAIPLLDKDELVGFVGFDSVRQHSNYSEREKKLLFLFGHMLINIRNRQKWEDKLRLQEEKYRNIITNMNLGLLEVDLSDTIIYANQSFCEMSGYTLAELKGRKAAGLFGSKEVEDYVISKNEIRRRNISDSYDVQVNNKNGEKRWWFVSGAPNYNDKGRLVGTIGIHLDITKQKNLETELAKAKSFAESAAKAKELFLANMSHEIRTPLNVIIGMIRQLTKENLSEDQFFFVKQSESSAKHLLTILNNVLDVAKIESGDMEIQSNPFSPSALFYNVHSIMYSQAKEKNLEFKINVSPELHSALIGDETRLRQVLINLIGNAIKFTQVGTIILNAEVKDTTDSHQTVLFEVKDTGIGMSEEFVSRIFDKFSQEQNDLNRKYEGTGLGMAISYDLIKLMGGLMKVQSVQDEGTVLSFELTLEKGDSNNLVNKGELVKEGAFSGKKALLVEDNEMNRFIAIQSLDYLGFVTTEVENGKLAVELIRKNNFDVILMDIQMPVMDGVEATTFIRNILNVKTPIIALTANAFKHDIELYLQKGMTDFITKPYDEQDFFRKLEHVLSISQQFTDEHKTYSKDFKKTYDLFHLQQLSRGNDSFVLKMINIFIKLANESIDNMEASLEIQDFNTIKKMAHKAKPSIEQMGVYSLKDVVRKVEKYDFEYGSSEDFSKAVRQLILGLKEVIAQLTRDFGL